MTRLRYRPTLRQLDGPVIDGLYGFDADEILPGLWMGSIPLEGRRLADAGFDAVVLCAEEFYWTKWDLPGLDVSLFPLDDEGGRLRPGDGPVAVAASQRAAAHVADGRVVLVACMAGLNRSGLVCALACRLLMEGEPWRAVDRVRERRAGAALGNTGMVVFATQADLT